MSEPTLNQEPLRVRYGSAGFDQVVEKANTRLAGKKGERIAFTGRADGQKLQAAEAIARRLKFQLHKVDLTPLVDEDFKRTEGNLREVFDTAAVSGSVLCLEGLGALLETAPEDQRSALLRYLLQRMEAYKGISILFLKNERPIEEQVQEEMDVVVSFE